MSSYKIPLLKAKPVEMKFLNSYASKIGGKMLVDNPDYVGFVKEINDNGQILQYPLRYPAEEDAAPPEGVESIPNQVAVLTEDNLESKKEGIDGLYAWAMSLDQAVYNSIALGPDENAEIQALLQKI